MNINIFGKDGFETVADKNNKGACVVWVRPKWISVKDKLPAPDELVLVYNKDEGVFRARRDHYDDQYPSWQCDPIGSYAGDGCVYDITHWMPLPEPPECTQ